MIEGMVASLAARLDADPSDAAGWARLVRSYMVLDRKDEARAALAEAQQALAEDPEKLSVVEAAARTLGLIE
jgi:cytochrome c-type biogenesis protein CcmH